MVGVEITEIPHRILVGRSLAIEASVVCTYTMAATTLTPMAYTGGFHSVKIFFYQLQLVGCQFPCVHLDRRNHRRVVMLYPVHRLFEVESGV